jgi:hypothetical protein
MCPASSAKAPRLVPTPPACPDKSFKYPKAASGVALTHEPPMPPTKARVLLATPCRVSLTAFERRGLGRTRRTHQLSAVTVPCPS